MTTAPPPAGGPVPGGPVRAAPEAERAAGLVHTVRAGSGPRPHRCVVMLHGQGGDEDAMWVFGRSVPAAWLVVAPRGPVEDEDGAFSWRVRGPAPLPTLHQFSAPLALLAAFVRSLPALYGTDPARTYLAGFSQGAAASFAFALAHRNLCAGIAGLYGFVPAGTTWTERRHPLDGLPVFLAAGTSDPYLSPAVAEAAAQTLREAGAEVEAHPYPGGHKLPRVGLRDLAAWWRRLP